MGCWPGGWGGNNSVSAHCSGQLLHPTRLLGQDGASSHPSRDRATLLPNTLCSMGTNQRRPGDHALPGV